MKLIYVNDHLWSIGMDWSFARPQNLSQVKLREQAHKLNTNFDIFAIRKQQYGFGVGKDGQLENWQKARSVAAFIKLPTASFLGIFALEAIENEKIWWVFGRYNGLNIGMGDYVCFSREDAEKQASDLLGLLGDQFAEQIDLIDCKTVAESLTWLTPLLQIDFGSLLKNRACLHPLQGAWRRPILLWSGLIIGIILCLWLFNMWLNYEAEQVALESAKLANLNHEQRKANLRAHPEEHFVKEWASAPLAEVIASRCVPQMKNLPTVSSGWLLSSAICQNGQTLTVSWLHQPNADFLFLPAHASLKNPQSAVSTSTLPIEPPVPHQIEDHEYLLTSEYATRELYQICQMTGTKLRLNFKPADKRTIDKTEITAPWVKGEWELSEIPAVLMLEPGLSQVLSELPGLTLDSITFKNDPSAAHWTFSGRIYAKSR